MQPTSSFSRLYIENSQTQGGKKKLEWLANIILNITKPFESRSGRYTLGEENKTTFGFWFGQGFLFSDTFTTGILQPLNGLCSVLAEIIADFMDKCNDLMIHVISDAESSYFWHE